MSTGRPTLEERLPLPLLFFWRIFYWSYERTTIPYDSMRVVSV